MRRLSSDTGAPVDPVPARPYPAIVTRLPTAGSGSPGFSKTTGVIFVIGVASEISAMSAVGKL